MSKLKLGLPDNWCTPDGCEPPEPKAQKPKRLTIETWKASPYHFCSDVCLDGAIVLESKGYDNEPEARAAAQAYVDELLKHFREGGE